MPQWSPKQVVHDAGILAAGCQNLRSLNPLRLNDEIFSEFLAPGFQSREHPPTDTRPSWYAATDALKTYVVIDGTVSWAQTNGILSGYIGGLFDSRFDPVNEYFQTAAYNVLVDILNTGISFAPQVWLGGYSLGGVCAMLLPSVSREIPPALLTCYVHSFGSPRAGGITACRTINGSCTQWRWMFDRDAVPLLIPHVNEFSGLVLALGGHAALRAQSFLHPAGGILLHPDGTHNNAEKPTQTQSYWTGALAAWLLDWDNGKYPGHALSNYLDAFTAAFNLLTNAGHLGGAEQEKAVQANRLEVEKQARTYAYNLAALEAQQNLGPLNVPDDHLFQAVKSGGAWVVQLGGEVVFAAGNKRAARRAAIEGNSLLRDLQHAAAVDVSALLERLTTYFGLATTQGTGFSPVMNTTFPQ